MSDHHPYGPSSLGLRFRCPGSAEMESKVLPTDKTDRGKDYASYGILVHALVALALAREYGVPYECDVDVSNPDEKARQGAQACLVWLDELLHKHGGVTTNEAGGNSIWLEHRVELPGMNHGWADVCAICVDGALVVVDWKSLWSADEASLLLQVACYGISARYTLLPVPILGPLVAAAYFPSPDREYIWESSSNASDEERYLYEQIRGVVENESRQLNPGEHCKQKCKAYTICPAVRREARAVRRLDPERLPVGLELEKALRGVQDFLRPLADAIESKCKEQLRGEPEKRGELYRLNPENGQRSCIGAQVPKLRAVAVRWMPAADFDALVKTSVSPTSVEARCIEGMIALGEAKSKKAAQERFRAATADCVTQPKVDKLRRNKA